MQKKKTTNALQSEVEMTSGLSAQLPLSTNAEN